MFSLWKFEEQKHDPLGAGLKQNNVYISHQLACLKDLFGIVCCIATLQCAMFGILLCQKLFGCWEMLEAKTRSCCWKASIKPPWLFPCESFWLCVASLFLALCCKVVLAEWCKPFFGLCGKSHAGFVVQAFVGYLIWQMCKPICGCLQAASNIFFATPIQSQCPMASSNWGPHRREKNKKTLKPGFTNIQIAWRKHISVDLFHLLGFLVPPQNLSPGV